MNQSDPNSDADYPVRTVLVQQSAPRRGRWFVWLLLTALGLSVMFNFAQLVAFSDYIAGGEAPYEEFHSGELTSSSKVARLDVGFTVMAPYTDRLIASIERAREDSAVKGVLLVVNSPGGLVSDSHQIYHELKQLSDSKPVVVAFKGLAASGGYYIAMGAGPKATIFAEPTTWTGSIGVIIPRYDVSELATKFGVESDSLSTGPFKDSLNPLKELSEEERKVWEVILKDSFDRFIGIIDDNRENLSEDDVRQLATGQVYTAEQALKNGLVDKIGYEKEALEELKNRLGLSSVRVIQYQYPQTLADVLLGASAKMEARARDPLTSLLEASVPRAMYLFGWHPGVEYTR